MRRGLLYIGVPMVERYGLCILSDAYFERFPSPVMMQNKYESRPYYLAVREENGIVWLIPLSSQVDKYRRAILASEAKRGKNTCIYQYICRVKGKDSVFLIGDAIPVTDSYIVRPFTVGGKPFVVQDKIDIKAIQSRFAKYLSLVRQGKLIPCIDVLSIEKELLTDLNTSK